MARYHRWIFEKRKHESVESLREWIIQEAEFQTIASEAARGLTTTVKVETQKTTKCSPRTFLETFRTSKTVEIHWQPKDALIRFATDSMEFGPVINSRK